MPGSDGGLVSCVGGCNSTIFKSRRVHRPLVEQQANIHLLPTNPPKEQPNYLRYSKYGYRPQLPAPDPLLPSTIKVKKSRKHRDRKYSFDVNFSYYHSLIQILCSIKSFWCRNPKRYNHQNRRLFGRRRHDKTIPTVSRSISVLVLRNSDRCHWCSRTGVRNRDSLQ